MGSGYFVEKGQLIILAFSPRPWVLILAEIISEEVVGFQYNPCGLTMRAQFECSEGIGRAQGFLQSLDREVWEWADLQILPPSGEK